MTELSIRNLEVTAPDGVVVINRVDWKIGEGLTTLMGPGGTGKSTLLAALAGTLNEGWHARGEVLRDAGSILHVPQRSPMAAHVRALASPATVLLDEPDSGLSAEERGGLVLALQARRERALRTVVVTHDVGLARELADDVALLVGGRMAAAGDAKTFFSAPPNELAARFVEQGNCWPAAEPPPLPKHFVWLEEGRIAGMGRPGLLAPVEDDLGAIASAGIVHLVSLTERAFDPALARSFGLQPRHFPIRDMNVPPIGRTQTLVSDLWRWADRGDPVAVHCKAGLGRTGTILGAYLAWGGVHGAASIEQVRAKNAAMIQNLAQERFIMMFAEQS